MKKDDKNKKGFQEAKQTPLDGTPLQPNKLKKGHLSEIFETALKAVEKMGKKTIH
ncbi:MAG: hypothetical protein WC612_00525 [Bdellovibrionales bacterium]|jgi:altronate dehydratase